VKSLCAFRETDGVATEIINGEVLPQENVTDDPEVATREVEVHSGECADALIAEIENIVGASDRVRVATEDKGEVGELWDLIAGNSVLSVPGAGSSNLGVDHLRDGGGQNNEGCSGINGGTSVLKFKLIIAECDGLELNLPVCFTAERDVGDVAGVVAGVDASEDSLATILLRIAQAESEKGLTQ